MGLFQCCIYLMYLEKLTKLNKFIQELDYARHPKPGFCNCFFTWVCGNASYATTKNARGTFFRTLKIGNI